MTKDQIRAIFLGAGFTIKEGQADLRPYVYDAAYCLLSASIADTAGAKSLTDAEIEAGWRHTFSTDNPYCPCNLKSFTKAVRWAERAKEKK